MVQLPRAAAERRAELLLEHRLRRICAPGAGRSWTGQEPLQGLPNARSIQGDAVADKAVVVVPRGDRPPQLRHREPHRAQEVQGRRGHGGRRWRLPPLRNVRNAQSRRHRSVQVQELGYRHEARARQEHELLGPQGETQPHHLPADRRRGRASAGAAERRDPRPRRSRSLKLLKRPTFSVGYVGMNQGIAPMNNPLVRQAVAYGLNRAAVVKFYAGNGKLANQFLPPALAGFAKKGVPKYSYNPTKAKALLRKAGLTLPVKVDFWYPTNVSRPYMPEPSRNFQAFAASLDNSGFKVVPHSGPWRPDYRAGVQAGRYQLFLFGWIADFADPADFLNVHFANYTKQFGFTNNGLFKLLKRADGEPNAARRVKLYQRASVQVMKYLPVVPYVWAGSAVAVRKNVVGDITDPIGPVNEPFSLVSVGGS